MKSVGDLIDSFKKRFGVYLAINVPLRNTKKRIESDIVTATAEQLVLLLKKSLIPRKNERFF